MNNPISSNPISSNPDSKQTMQELLAKARASLQANQAGLDQLETITTSADSIDLSNIPHSTDAEKDIAVDIIRDIAETLAETLAETKAEAKAKVSSEFKTTKEYGVAKEVILNPEQQSFQDLVLSGKDGVLIGSAGTGKTTCMRSVTRALINGKTLPAMTASTKWLQYGNPGAVIISYTRKAVNNIRHAVVDELKAHTITIHKLLEYAPVFYEIEDPANPNNFKKTMRFEPTRNYSNPLPGSLVFLAYEESSMIPVDLYQQLQDALPHPHQEVFLGDIQQLPPIFGMAVLGFKMLSETVVQLVTPYRQALDSPILAMAWKILEGNPHDFSSKKEFYKTYSALAGKEVERFRVPALDKHTGIQRAEADNPESEILSQLILQPWQKKLSPEAGLNTLVMQLRTWADDGYYNPDDDIILCPFNESFGTIEINKGIAQHLGVKRDATIYEVIAGYSKHYLAVGDRVLYDKEDAFITAIHRNGEYLGKPALVPAKGLDRWGHYRTDLTENERLAKEANSDLEATLEAMETFLEKAAAGIEDRVTAASHTIHIKLAYQQEEDSQEIILSQAAEVNNLLGGYALTVHKSQGSEWDRGFFVMQQAHATMNQRELLYTAVTRFKKFLHIICEADTFEKGIKSQRIKGNTLREKAEFFKGKSRGEGTDDESEAAKAARKTGGTFKPHTYTDVSYNNSLPPALPEISPQISTQEKKQPDAIIDWESLVSIEFRKEAMAELETFWAKATKIWGASIGERPNISYALHISDILGRAYEHSNLIKLNSVWCLVAEQSPEAKKEMLQTTLRHEACHIIATRFSKEKAHGAGWVMAMKLMGEVPNEFYDDNILPSWADAYLGLISEIRNKKQQEANEMAKYSTMANDGRNHVRYEETVAVDTTEPKAETLEQKTSSGEDIIAAAKAKLAALRSGKK
jgi:predicted SprT family Zn-dependent metalloprotease